MWEMGTKVRLGKVNWLDLMERLASQKDYSEKISYYLLRKEITSEAWKLHPLRLALSEYWLYFWSCVQGHRAQGGPQKDKEETWILKARSMGRKLLPPQRDRPDSWEHSSN